MKMQPLNTAVTSALFASLVAGSASAQEAPSSTTALMMEEIVVSARGIEEGLQTPIAVRHLLARRSITGASAVSIK